MTTRIEPTVARLHPPPAHIVWTIAATLIGAALLFGPGTFLSGRMWAEEASEFLPPLIGRDFAGATFMIYRGTLQIPTNWSVWAAARFALLDIPVVTFWSSMAVMMLLAGLFGWWARVTGISAWVAALGIFAFLTIESIGEVIGTSTNLQWLFSLCTLLVLIMPTDMLQRRFGRYAALIALAGMDGVPSCMLAPAFLLRARTERSRPLAIFGAILSASGLIQIALLLTSSPFGRSFHLHPALFVVSIALHLAHPFAPAELIHRIGLGFLDDKGRTAIVLGAEAIGAAAFIGLGRMARVRGVHPRAPFRLIALALLITMANLFGAIGDQYMMIAAPLDGRYFVFLLFCVIVLLATATRSEHRAIRIIAVTLLGLAAVIGASRHITALRNGIPQAPGWAMQIADCRARSDTVCRLHVLPIGSDGQFWTAFLPSSTLYAPPRRRHLP